MRWRRTPEDGAKCLSQERKELAERYTIDAATALKRRQLAAEKARRQTEEEQGTGALRAESQPVIAPRSDQAATGTPSEPAAPPSSNDDGQSSRGDGSPVDRALSIDLFSPLFEQLSKLRGQLDELVADFEAVPRASRSITSVVRLLTDAVAVIALRARDLRVGSRAAPLSLGWFPALSLVAASGVLIMAVADATSRAALGFGYSEPLFWLAIVVIVAPIAYRVSRPGLGPNERLGLVVLAALALYVVKVLRDPFLFTYPDELVHVTNANAILGSGKLFTANHILPATPAYPGLPAAAAALASITGLSTFGAGLLIVGAARLIITLALFLLFKELTSSSRVAGIAALAYCGNPNYLFFSAEFSYESLALPLAVVVLYCVARWLKGEGDNDDRGLLVCAAVVGTAVVTTHHITSYALLLSLLGIATAVALRDRPRGWVLGGLSLLLAFVTLLWLKVVAGRTATYLGAIFGRALGSIEHTIQREQGTRGVLSSGSGGPPPWDRMLAYLWILTLLVTIVLGVLKIRRDYRGNILAIGLAGAGIAYLGVLPLRLVSGAWELANRSSEFLFIGVALLIAFACGYLVRLRYGPLPARSAVVVLVVVAGGALGWPRDLRTAEALKVSAGGATLEPPMLTAVRWAGSHLGSGQTFDGGDVDARFLGSVAHDQVYAGFSPFDISDVITMSTRRVPEWGLRNLRETKAGFVFIDQRQQAGDRLHAPYFHSATLNSSNALNSPNEFLKFDRQPGTSRIYDGGSIKIYDIRRMVDAARRK